MNEISTTQLEAAISGYVDPYVKQDLVTAKLIKDLRMDGNTARVEVELGFWVDFERLRRAPVLDRPARRGDRRFTMRGWELDEGFLWGATAMILAELIALMSAD